jgi:hypothetical protein
MKNAILIVSVISLTILLILPNACKMEETAGSITFTRKVPDIVDFNFHVKPILSDRCFKCHGPDANTREADLRFDIKEGAFVALGEKKDRFAIVAGDTASSMLVHRIYADDPDDIMPPPESNLTLDAYEKELLTKWIAQGAKWKKHWSFLPVTKPDVPDISNKSWAQNEIDHFILSKLEADGIPPAEKASKEKLIRRVSFDLTGLPPTIEEIEDFLNDYRPEAYEKLIDRLLQTDAYAEKMAMHWMDLARYADTHGYQDDLERTMYPWRDWVIHAYNQNMPYDQFVKWQLAGDLLPNPTREQIIATAFNRNHKITQEGGVIPEEYRVEYVSDRTQTFGTAFLGLTMECAKCHDHKYDPISQKDFYQLFAFFNNIPEQGLIEPYGAIPEPYITLTKEEIEETLHFIGNIDTIKEIPLMVMEEMKQPRQAYLLTRGAYDKHGEPVFPEAPSALAALDEDQPKNRLGLAEWLFDPGHPLTSRVMANRLWQQCFGKGIVSSSFDFGNQGTLPTHPELLDWLAIKLQESGWDIKKTLKYIAMSSTYQQSAKVSKELLEQDPENLLLARAPRLRLDAEMIRDHALAISGLLNKSIGGPSVKPYQPPGLWEETTGGGGGSTAKYVPDEGAKVYRRSMYTFWKRTVPPPSMMTFDATTRDFCTVIRQSTSTPLQALVLLNDPQIIEACRVLADKAVGYHKDEKDRIRVMFRLATSRTPNEEELDNLHDFYKLEKDRFTENPADAESYLAIGQYQQKELSNLSEIAALAVVANAIFNLDETITRG